MDEAVKPGSSEERPLVAAVVLTWNDVDLARNCIRSVLKNKYKPLRVILVDNGSSFPTIPPLLEEFPEIETVALSENLGFAGGCNRGMERALDMGADYVFLLNNDTIVHEDAILELTKVMETRTDAAMASALVLNLGEEKRIHSYQSRVFRNRARVESNYENALVQDLHRKVVETEFAPACAVMFRGSALKDVGLFDESLFTNYEDYDLCIRFADAGWTILIAGTAEVIHAHGQTTGLASPFITYFSVRNRLICLFRHGQFFAITKNLPFIIRSFYWQVKAYGFTNWPCHRAAAKALVHFILGIRGEGNAPSNRDDAMTGQKR